MSIPQLIRSLRPYVFYAIAIHTKKEEKSYHDNLNRRGGIVLRNLGFSSSMVLKLIPSLAAMMLSFLSNNWFFNWMNSICLDRSLWAASLAVMALQRIVFICQYKSMVRKYFAYLAWVEPVSGIQRISSALTFASGLFLRFYRASFSILSISFCSSGMVLA